MLELTSRGHRKMAYTSHSTCTFVQKAFVVSDCTAESPVLMDTRVCATSREAVGAMKQPRRLPHMHPCTVAPSGSPAREDSKIKISNKSRAFETKIGFRWNKSETPEPGPKRGLSFHPHLSNLKITTVARKWLRCKSHSKQLQ